MRAHRLLRLSALPGVRCHSTAAPAGWTLTLERGVGKAYGAEAQLQDTRAFAAEVFPDLPIATTWQTLIKALKGGQTEAAAAAPPFTHYATRPGAHKVITVAANLRNMYDIEQRVSLAAGEAAGAAGGQRADALLCVSGSHPVRTLPFISRFSHSSLDTLRAIQQIKARGAIPESTQAWVVANPNTERDASLLERKVELGATTVLTQPPLDWPAYLRWMDDAERRGLLAPGGGGGGGGGAAGVRVLVGHPVLSSSGNAAFWLALSGCSGSKEAQQVAAAASKAELGGTEAAEQHFLEYNRRLIQQVLERGGAGGLHVMPITKAAKRMVAQMLNEGSLPPSSSSSGGGNGGDGSNGEKSDAGAAREAMPSV